MLWAPNSPDLNTSEPAWYWLKRKTIARGASSNGKELERAWRRDWQTLPQETCRHWVEAIPGHIKHIIRLKGGNKYLKGVEGFKRSFKGRRVKGKLSFYTFLDRSERSLVDGDNNDFEDIEQDKADEEEQV